MSVGFQCAHHDELCKCFRSGDIYQLVADMSVRTVLDVHVMASKNAQQGDTRLAQFCNSVGVDKLSELIRSAVAIVNAPATLAMKASTRIERLRLAASDGHCSCNGDWIPGAIRVLTNNREDLNGFCADVLCALRFGACRGTNMTVVGVPGSGKSMVFEPFNLIFQVIPTFTYIDKHKTAQAHRKGSVRLCWEPAKPRPPASRSLPTRRSPPVRPPPAS